MGLLLDPALHKGAIVQPSRAQNLVCDGRVGMLGFMDSTVLSTVAVYCSAYWLDSSMTSGCIPRNMRLPDNGTGLSCVAYATQSACLQVVHQHQCLIGSESDLYVVHL